MNSLFDTLNKRFSHTLLEGHFLFRASLEDLEKHLKDKKAKKFAISFIDQSNFKFESNWSLGTFQKRAGIYGFASCTEGIKGYVKIRLYTRIRRELYLITAMVLVSFISLPFMEEAIPI